MSKTIAFFLLIFYFFSYNSSAQDEFKYFGAVMLSDSSMISYRVILKNNKGQITGYSITDIGGEHETRSNVFGEYNEEGKELSFRETDIVYTKSEVTEYDFCFINSTIKNFRFGKSKQIKTPFVGLFSDNTECISGELLLTEEEKVKKALNKASKIIQKSKKISDSIKKKADPIKMMEERNKNVLKKNQTLSVFSHNSSIKLYIYDSGEVDNDRVTLKVNSVPVLTNYAVEKEKRVIEVPLKTIVTSIEIKALNEGNIGKNTMRVLIKDGDNKTTSVLTSLNTGDIAKVNIHKR